MEKYQPKYFGFGMEQSRVHPPSVKQNPISVLGQFEISPIIFLAIYL